MSSIAKIEKTRARVAALKRQIAEIASVERSPAEVRDLLAAHLTEVEAEGRRALARRVAGLSDGDTPLGTLAPLGNDLSPVLLALMGADAVMSALDRHVAALPAAPDRAQRLAKLEALRADLFAAEVEEEALIVAAEHRNEPVLRRADADPAAVLYLPNAAEA